MEELPSGRLRRFYLRRTVWDYADSRRLRHSIGRPPGTTSQSRQPHWYADDPRLAEAIRLVARADTARTSTRGLGVELARRLNVSPSTGRRLIATARRLRPPPTASS